MESVIGFLLGSVLGSFCLVLANRSLTNKSLWGRSYCPNCKKNLAWFDLFPILSYLILRGCCRYCRKKIKVEHLVVELAMGLVIGFLFWQTFNSFQLLDFSFQAINFKFITFIFELIIKTFFIVILVSLFITDYKEMLIPDRIIIPAIRIGFIALLLLTIYKIGFLYYILFQNPLGKYLLPPLSNYFVRHALITAEPLLGGIILGLLIGGFFWLLIILTKGKGMGGGDVKLGGFIGLMLGFPQGLLAIVLSFIVGAFFSVGLLILGKKSFGQTIAFGPFLVMGSLMALFWGNKIIDWYLSLSFR